MVDPAVLDALEDFVARQPGAVPRPPRPRLRRRRPSEPRASPAAPRRRVPERLAPRPANRPTTPRRPAPRAVLDGFLASARGADLLTVGYADPDVVALARRRSTLVTRADTLARRRLAARGLDAQRAVVPPDGYFDPALLPEVSRDSLFLLSDQGRDRANPTATRLATGQPLVLADARASAGGPGPSRAFEALAVRQRVLAESLLEQQAPSLDGRPRPVVVALPARWDPGPAWREADLFGTLSQARWLRLAPLDRAATTTYDGKLPYGRNQLVQEIGQTNVDATRSLVRTGAVLGHLLDNDNDVRDTLTGAAIAPRPTAPARTGAWPSTRPRTWRPARVASSTRCRSASASTSWCSPAAPASSP